MFKVLIEHKENCLITNGKQSVKLKCGSISFKNYFKLLPVPFKIYVDFECLLKGVKSSNKNNGSYSEKYQEHIPWNYARKVVCTDSKFSKRVGLYRRKNTVYMFIEAILNEYDYFKRILLCLQKKKKDFN